MTKGDYLAELRSLLHQLPQEELDQTVGFYAELIEDKIEEGYSEEQAVADMEPPRELARRILKDMPPSPRRSAPAKSQVKKADSIPDWAKVLIIVLIVISCPAWLSLGAVILSVVVALFLALWGVGLALAAALVGLVIAALAVIIYSIFMLFFNAPVGLALLGCGLALSGLIIIGWYVVKYSVLGIISLSRALGRGIKSLFKRRS